MGVMIIFRITFLTRYQFHSLVCEIIVLLNTYVVIIQQGNKIARVFKGLHGYFLTL